MSKVDTESLLLMLCKHNAFWERHEFFKFGYEDPDGKMSIATTQQQFHSNTNVHHPYRNYTMMDPSSSQSSSINNAQCGPCLTRFLEYRNQAINRMTLEYQKFLTGQGIPAIDSLNHIVYQSLRLGDNELAGTVNGKCLYCDIHIESLKKRALEVVQTRFNPFLRNMFPYNQDTNTDQHLSDRNMATRGESTDCFNGFRIPGVNNTVGGSRDSAAYQYAPNHAHQDVGKNYHHSSSSAASSTTQQQRTLTSQQFFNEVAKKCVKQKRQSNKQKIKESLFPTNFSYMLKHSPPLNPPGLFKYMGRRVDGKVSVMLRVQPTNDQSDSLIAIDQRNKQISFLAPNSSANVIPGTQAPPSQPKLFAFDNIFEPEIRQDRVSAGSLLDVLHAVINGGDGAVVTYGGPETGKTQTMMGQDDNKVTAGIIPCAIAWLYSLIDDYKQRTGARISVRVSAVEVVGKNEDLKDLLSEQAPGTDSIDSHSASPGIYLSEDPLKGITLGNVSEPQAADAEKAGFYLDAALASRTTDKDENNDSVQNSHMIFTFHIYQYRVEKNVRRYPQGSVPYSGGRSRLHLIDLSYVNQNFEEKSAQAPSHAALGQIIITMLNGNKKVTLFKDSKICRLLKDSIGNLTCRSTVIAHVSSEEKNYRKTLQTLNITQKIQRKRRKRNKNYSSSSDNNSCDESKQTFRVQHPLVSTRALEDVTPCSDYNTSSAGEDSCDTVIYMGNNGHISDRDLTDNERPPSPATMKIMKLKLSSSEDENTDTGDSLTPSRNSTEDLRMKLSTLDELEKKNAPLMPKKKNGKIEVNVVAPLVVKETASLPQTSSIVEDLKINRSETSSDVILPPPPSHEKAPSQASVVSNISEKYLRNHEKRIEQILATNIDMALSDNEGMEQKYNRRNKQTDGYASDIAGTPSHFRRHRSNTRDGYISAPESSKPRKPVQIVKGTVRKQQSLDETEISRKENAESYNSQDDIEKETCLDDIIKNIDTSTPKQTERSSNVDSIKILPLTVGRFSSIRESTEPQKVIPTERPETVQENETQVNDLSTQCVPSTSGIDETDMNETGSLSSGKLQNLNHIITLSPIPNFTVTKKPSLVQLPSSPTLPLRQNVCRDTMERTCSPRFERSYSREDTISVVSAYESDAYDSDAFASPALNSSRSQRNPTRLRYRWSTVYEEPEDKKLEKSKQKKTVVDSEAKPSRMITSPKSSSKNRHSNSGSKSSLTSRFTKSPKPSSVSSSETPKSSKKHLKSSEQPLSPTIPKEKSKFSILSPRSERKNKKTPNYSPDKRMSGCSDASSGLDSGIHSQTSSLRSGEDIKVDDRTIVREETRSSKTRLWPFGRSKSRKSSRSLSGYVSDGHITESTRSRRSRFFGSRSSKSSLNTEGYCSGYETSVTEGGMTSCNEDYTDNESVSGKKKRRFLGFRRRSTNDLSSTRGRVKKPIWFDKRGCQSDSEDLQLKVYQIDDPHEVNKRRTKSENAMGASATSSKRIEGLRKQHEQLKKPVGYMKYIPASTSYQEQKVYAENLERQNTEIGKKLKHIKNHIQVVTCFDGTSRKVTQI